MLGRIGGLHRTLDTVLVLLLRVRWGWWASFVGRLPVSVEEPEHGSDGLLGGVDAVDESFAVYRDDVVGILGVVPGFA